MSGPAEVPLTPKKWVTVESGERDRRRVILSQDKESTADREFFLPGIRDAENSKPNNAAYKHRQRSTWVSN